MVKYAISTVYFVIPKCLKSCSPERNPRLGVGALNLIIPFVIEAFGIWEHCQEFCVNLETHISLRCA